MGSSYSHDTRFRGVNAAGSQDLLDPMFMSAIDSPTHEFSVKGTILSKEMEAKLLQKIEQLTLYTIDQENKTPGQNKNINKSASSDLILNRASRKNLIL